MSAPELRQLRLLLDLRVRAKEACIGFQELLEDYVLEMRETGASVRGVADALGVSSSTVQAWTKAATRRRGAGESPRS